MKTATLRTLFAGLLFAAVGAFATGCVQDEGSSGCDSDEDCPAQSACIEGQCEAFGGDVDPDSSSDTEDGDDADTPTPDVCSVRCDTRWQEAQGCECVPKSCETATDCSGVACVDGECQLCESDAQCAEDQICTEGGECRTGSRCEADDDCPPNQLCGDDGVCVDREGCLTDDDCGDQEICFNGQCAYSPECESDDDCREDMECVSGQCYEAICRGDDDCEGDQVCNAGECEEPQGADRCVVATQSGKIAEDERVALEAFALDEDGNGVPAEFDWESTEPSVAAIGPNGAFAVGGSSSGTTEIRASLASDGTDCEGSAELTNLGSVPSDQVRVVTTDANTKSPIQGAEVVIDGNTAQTDGAGVATMSKPSDAFTVSVFHPDYNWITVEDVQSPDLRIPLRRREGQGPIAGFSGQFDTSQLNTSGDVTIGLAGASITGGLLEVGVEELLGPPYRREVQTPEGSGEVPINSGLVVTGQSSFVDIKDTYYARSRGGPRLGWGMAGQVELQELFQEFQGGVEGNFLATILQLFNRFDHGNRPMTLSERPRVADSEDLDGDGNTSEMIPDWDNLPEESLAPSVRQNLVTEVTVSNFPDLGDSTADTAVLVGGVISDSAGFVPLGISAATDENEDGSPDVQTLSVAPPYGSLTGSRYAVMALAFSSDSFDPQSGLALPENYSVALWTSQQSFPSRVGLGTFPDTTSGTVDRNNRTVEIQTDAGPVYRVRMVGSDRTWELWTRGPSGSSGSYSASISVPQVPGGRADLFTNGELSVDAVEVGVTMDDLLKSTGVGLRQIGLVATSFNRSSLVQSSSGSP